MMGVPERNREALPKKNIEVSEVSNEQVLEAIHEMKDIQMQLADYMETVKSHQTVLTDKLAEHSIQYKEVMGLFAESEAARTKAQQGVKTTQEQLIEVGKKLLNRVDKSDKDMKDFLSGREIKLDEAIHHAKSLGPEMQAGFGRLIQQSTPSVKQKISQHIRQAAMIASSSVAGGVVVFLLCLWIFHGSFHTSTEKSSTPAATTTHHTASKKTK